MVLGRVADLKRLQSCEQEFSVFLFSMTGGKIIYFH